MAVLSHFSRIILMGHVAINAPLTSAAETAATLSLTHGLLVLNFKINHQLSMVPRQMLHLVQVIYWRHQGNEHHKPEAFVLILIYTLYAFICVAYLLEFK